MTEVRAGIVVTGTEVLTGRIGDRNGPWVSERLAGLGVDVAHIIVVGDRPDDLEAALGFLSSAGMDLIVTSGGLGPTADDLTAEVVARFCRPRACARRGDGGEDRGDPARLRAAASASTRRRSAPPTASRRWFPRVRSRLTLWAPRLVWSCRRASVC